MLLMLSLVFIRLTCQNDCNHLRIFCTAVAIWLKPVWFRLPFFLSFLLIRHWLDHTISAAFCVHLLFWRSTNTLLQSIQEYWHNENLVQTGILRLLQVFFLHKTNISLSFPKSTSYVFLTRYIISNLCFHVYELFFCLFQFLIFHLYIRCRSIPSLEKWGDAVYLRVSVPLHAWLNNYTFCAAQFIASQVVSTQTRTSAAFHLFFFLPPSRPPSHPIHPSICRAASSHPKRLGGRRSLSSGAFVSSKLMKLSSFTASRRHTGCDAMTCVQRTQIQLIVVVADSVHHERRIAPTHTHAARPEAITQRAHAQIWFTGHRRYRPMGGQRV